MVKLILPRSLRPFLMCLGLAAFVASPVGAMPPPAKATRKPSKPLPPPTSATKLVDPGLPPQDGRPSELIQIPGGTFEHDLEFAPGRVQPPAKIETFKLEKHEVTVRQYLRCWQAKVCDAPVVGRSPYGTWMKEGFRDHPVVGVRRVDARKYCKFIGRRLPTRWEWEWAARGREWNRKFVWGDPKPTNENLPKLACTGRGSAGTEEGTCRAMAMRNDRTRDGVYDMAGNVQEIVDTNAGAPGQAGAERYQGMGGSYQSSSWRGVRIPRTWSDNPTDGDHTRRASRGFRCADEPHHRPIPDTPPPPPPGGHRK